MTVTAWAGAAEIFGHDRPHIAVRSDAQFDRCRKQHYRTQNNPQNTEYAPCLVNVSPVAELTTGESVVTPSNREFHGLSGGLFVA